MADIIGSKTVGEVIDKMRAARENTQKTKGNIFFCQCDQLK